MPSIRPVGPAVLLAASLAGCEPVAPSTDDLAAFAFAQPVDFRCRTWSPSKPAVQRGLFDVAFAPAALEAAPPTSAQRDAVLRVQGRIVHEFHVPWIRALLSIDSVPRLEALRAAGVRDARVFDVAVTIAWSSADSVANEVLLAQLGATKRSTFRVYQTDGNSLLATHVTLPDSGIAVLRTHPAVAAIWNEPLAACEVAIPR